MSINKHINSQDYYYESLRNRNVEDYGRRFETWAPKILVDQYSERTHFIYELLQNAEDALASNVWFRLYFDRLEFEHDGKKEFDENDIKGICGVSNNSKNPNVNIGKFGIGFKSVFAYTSTPKVITRNWSFEIKNIIMPHSIKERLQTKNTKFVIPLNKEDPNKENAFDEISDALKNDLMADSILFLDNIFNINIEIVNDSLYYPTTKSIVDINENIQMVELNDGDEDSKATYILFKKKVKMENEIMKHVKIAYKINKVIEKTNYKYIYVYFATSQESHLGFCVHAPFNTTPARDNINSLKRDKSNKLLTDSLADLAEESIIWLRDNNLISLDFCSNVLPISPNLHEVLKPIYYRVYSMFKNKEKLIPTNDGSYENINNVLLPEAQNMVPIFSDNILKRVYKDDKVKWAKMEIAFDLHNEFNLYLRENFSVTRLNSEQIFKGLTSAILEDQSDKWLISLFDFVAPRRYVHSRSSSIPEQTLKKIPLVRLKTGRHTTCRSDIYLNNDKIKEEIINNSSGVFFYKEILKIPYLDEKRAFINKTMKKYEKNKGIVYEDNIKDLKKIKNLISDGVLKADDLLDYAFILASNMKNELCWCFPNQVFITGSYTGCKTFEILLGNLNENDIYFLSNIYSDIFDKEFFEKLGVKSEIQIDYDGGLNRQVNTNRSCYFRTSSLANNINFNYRFRITLLCNIIKNEMSFEKSVEIFKLAKKYEDMIADVVEWNSRLDFSPDASESGRKIIFSDFGYVLNNCAWIYGKDGKVYKPTDIKVNKIRDEYKELSSNVILKLGFKGKDSIAMQKAIDSLAEGPKKRLLELITDEEAKEILELREKREQEKQKPDKSLEEALSQQNNYKKNNYNEKDDEIENSSILNLERRAGKLEKEFSESMGESTIINKKLTYTCVTSNKDEREFLKKEYKGKCQICDKVIKTYNNKIIFYSRNVIKTMDLPAEYKNVDYTGWNSLCLCPNCAIEYLYGEKSLSTFSNQVEKKDVEEGSTESIYIEITLQGEKKKIKYTPKHFLALKTAFNVFK